MTFREIAWGSAEYAAEIRLRNEILRKPLGLSLEDEDLAPEREQLHYGLFDPAGTLAACAVAVPLSQTEARIRQMAVVPSRQGGGLGKKLMTELEADLRARGFERFQLNARASAVGFYEKLGYSIVGDEFREVTVPHFRMTKAAS